METIRFYDFDFCPIWDLQKLISVNWLLYYNDIGTFELHTNLQEGLAGALQAHPYLIAVQGEKQAIIVGRRFQGHECILYGRTCNWLLTRRVTPAFETQTANVETLCRQFVSDAFEDVSELILGVKPNRTNEFEFEQKNDCTTFEAVRSALDKMGAGHRLRIDLRNRKWIFDIFLGKPVTLTLSEDFRNIYDSVYTEDCLSYYTGGWYEAEQTADEGGEAAEAVRTYLAGDTEKTGIYRWECILNHTTQEQAKNELEQQKWNKEITAKLRNVRFGREYGLGDFLVFKTRIGSDLLSAQKQVEGVHIWYESGEVGEEPILS